MKILNNIQRIIYFIIATWLLVCTSSSLYLYFNPQIIPNIYSFNQSNNTDTSDEFRFEINNITDGKVCGNITISAGSDSSKKAIASGEEVHLVYQTLSGNPMTGEWLRLESPETRFDKTIVRSKENTCLSGYQSKSIKTKLSNHFPFDQYFIIVIPKIVVVGKHADIIFDNYISYSELELNLGETFIGKKSDYDPISNRLLEKNEHIILIQRPAWFLWFLGGMLGFLMIPILILANSSVNDLSIDIIGLLISLFTVRAFVLGGSEKIYVFDIILCGFALAAAFIVIFKLYKKTKIL